MLDRKLRSVGRIASGFHLQKTRQNHIRNYSPGSGIHNLSSVSPSLSV
jgi:hypothetical protein